MSRTRFAYLAVASLFVAAIWLAPAAQSRPSAASSTLVVSFTTAPDTLDPQKSPLNQTWPAWQLSYECLLKATADGKIQPQLATSYKSDAAGLNYDFTLRPGVRFHNGALMTSADVVYTFDRLKTSGIPYAQNRFPTLTSVTAQGPRAVRFTLSKADPGFLLNMGDPFTVACAILSRKAGAVEGSHHRDGRHGAVRDGVVRADASAEGEAFDKYWGTKANVANIQVDYTPEASAQLVALLAGKADLIFPDPSIVRPLKGASKTIKIGSVIAATTLRVEFSAAKAPFNNVNVRRAVELAIDRPEAIRGAYLGYGSPAAHIPTGYPWAPALKSYKYIGKHDVAASEAAAGAGGLSERLQHLVHVHRRELAGVGSLRPGAQEPARRRGHRPHPRPGRYPHLPRQAGEGGLRPRLQPVSVLLGPTALRQPPARPQRAGTGCGSVGDRQGARLRRRTRTISSRFATSRSPRTTRPSRTSSWPRRRSSSPIAGT